MFVPASGHLEAHHGQDPDYDRALHRYFQPYHSLVDLMVRLSVNEESLTKMLVDLSAMVGLDGVALHMQFFPKLWTDIYNTEQIDRKFIQMLLSSHGFLEYVDAVLLDERTSLNNPHIFQFLYTFFPKVSDQVLTDQVLHIVHQLVQNFIENAGAFSFQRATPIKHLNGDLRALVLVTPSCSDKQQRSSSSQQLSQQQSSQQLRINVASNRLLRALKILRAKAISILTEINSQQQQRQQTPPPPPTPTQSSQESGGGSSIKKRKRSSDSDEPESAASESAAHQQRSGEKGAGASEATASISSAKKRLFPAEDASTSGGDTTDTKKRKTSGDVVVDRGSSSSAGNGSSSSRLSSAEKGGTVKMRDTLNTFLKTIQVLSKICVQSVAAAAAAAAAAASSASDDDDEDDDSDDSGGDEEDDKKVTKKEVKKEEKDANVTGSKEKKEHGDVTGSKKKKGDNDDVTGKDDDVTLNRKKM